MKQFPEMWIPCTEQEYPEVKQLLEGMGYEIRGLDFLKQPTWYTGITVFKKGTYVANICNLVYHPTVTLPELREMALQQKPQAIDDDLRLLKERVGIMERSIMGMETKINEIHQLLFEE